MFTIMGSSLKGPRLSLAEAAIGAAVPAAFLWLTGELFHRIRHKEGLGFGDVKMIAAVGAFTGLSGVLRTLVLGSLMGSVFGVIFVLVTRKDHKTYELPFGSFLGAAAVLVTLLDPRVLTMLAPK
jgi:leader peptidase (prepilin peptidase)/N-methyltransferase